MEVEILWTEQVAYRSSITVPEDEIRLWMADESWRGRVPPAHQDPAKANPQLEITADIVKEWLEIGDEDVWFEQTDTLQDFQNVDDRSLDEVQL